MPNEEMTLEEGTVLKGRYVIGERIGHGGCGVTYLASDLKQNGLTVVVKQFNPNYSNPKKQKTPKVIAGLKIAFEKEAELLKELGDSYRLIPKRYDFFEEDGNLYIVQEFIAGEDLSSVLGGGNVLPEAQTINMIRNILIPLQDLHSRDIIHRDLKPSNIRMRLVNGDEYELVLIDFGISKKMRDDDDTGLVTEMGIGTRGYRPPEQEKAKPELASDIYPIGIMALQAITGLEVSELSRFYSEKDGKILPNAKIEATPKLIEFLKYTLIHDLKLRYSNAKDALYYLDNPDKIVTFDIAAKARDNTVTEGNLSSQPTNKRSKLSLPKIIGVIGLLIGIPSSIITISTGWTPLLEKVREIGSETSSYENKKYNIKFEYPKNWVKEELTTDTITREVVNFTQPSSSNNSVLPTISIVIRSVSNEQDTLEKLIESEIDGIDQASIIKTGRPTISGREAYNLIYTVTDESSVTTEYLKVFFKTDKNIYVITYSSNKSDFDKYSKVVDNIIKSIKVKNSSRS